MTAIFIENTIWRSIHHLQIQTSFSMLLLILVSTILDMGKAIIHGPADYCMADTFEPRCNPDEVIMIKSALYGRMKPGKCSPKEQGNFGCSADVQDIMDSLCSGRQSCSVNGIHPDLVFTEPCPGAMGYLSVSYSCMAVTNVGDRCQNQGEVIISESSGFLSTTTQRSAKNICPVSVSMPSGQLMKFTIYNFMKKSGSACYEVAVIKEKTNQKSVHVCQSDPRTKEILMTSSSHVTVDFSDFQIGGTVGSFLLHYEATGCPQPTVPSHAHLERNGDTAKIICNNSENSWFIYCKNDEWTEHSRKCPSDWGITKIFKSDSSFPYGIFLTSFVGVGIGIFLGGFLLFLAINAFQRHQRRLRQMYEAPPVIPDPDYKIYDTSKMDFTLVPGFATGRHTIPRHQMSPPPIPSQPPEDERRFSRHTYEKPKYNSTDNQQFMEA